MNNKESFLYKVVEAVVSCCATRLADGSMSVTTEDVLSKDRIGECANMTRCILVRQLGVMGYSIETIAGILQRTESTVRDMMNRGNDFELTSYAYHIASAESALKCKKLMAEF